MDADQTGTDITDLVTPRGVIAQLRAPTKRQVLQELGRRAAAMTGLPDRRIYDALAERERLGTTGIGTGGAIPHCRLSELTRLHGLFARLERPVPFEAIDDQPVDLVFLLLAPLDAGAGPLKAVAGGSRPPPNAPPRHGREAARRQQRRRAVRAADRQPRRVTVIPAKRE